MMLPVGIRWEYRKSIYRRENILIFWRLITKDKIFQGLRHGPATYFHPNGNKEEATYVEGYEEVVSMTFVNFAIRRNLTKSLFLGRVYCLLCKRQGDPKSFYHFLYIYIYLWSYYILGDYIFSVFIFISILGDKLVGKCRRVKSKLTSVQTNYGNTDWQFSGLI